MKAQVRRRQLWMICVLANLCFAAAVSTASGQQPTQPHLRHSADFLPGRVGQEQLARGPGMHGFFQPVQIQAPQGANLSLLMEGELVSQETNVAKAGLLIGAVYRFRVTQIPGHPGFEIYPTVEVINRLYPPEGLEGKFPIPVDVTQEELELALDGKLVTRVIYLEDPEYALPIAQRGTDQRVFDISPRDDPLHVADRLGRPMAILRIGSRVNTGQDPQAFFFGMPPIRPLED